MDKQITMISFEGWVAEDEFHERHLIYERDQNRFILPFRNYYADKDSVKVLMTPTKISKWRVTLEELEEE